MTLNVEPCLLGPIWLMTPPSEHCHTHGGVYGSQIKKDKQNLTLMTLNVEPCLLGPIW